MSRRAVPILLAAGAAACGGHRPPADYAPDPGLVGRIREIRIETPEAACPGRTFTARYVAELDDGSLMPFDTRYDEDHPPALHVVALDRSSREADPLGSGGWRVDPDPLVSALDGIELRAVLRARPELTATAAVAPDYSCLPHVFTFEGATGRRGEPGVDGPDVTVRLALGQSRFYDNLLVIGIAVQDAPPFYLLADADAVPPADWLHVESRGGRGGRGADGTDGSPGAPGTAGCPGTPGVPGGAGGAGGRGSPGGRGGRVTVMAPQDQPFLAGLLDTRSAGGEGGPGGRGGRGGKGGNGGAASPPDNPRCVAGTAGTDGPHGLAGRDGPDGPVGPRPAVLIVPAANVFGARAPSAVRALLERPN